MSTPSPLFYRSACAAAFLAAALAGWHFTGSAASTTAGAGSGPASAGKDHRRGERSLRNGGVPAHVRETLAAIRNAGSPDQRMRATIDLASNMPLADLAEWLEKRWFDTGEGFDLTLFSKIAMQRWEAEDREGLIAWSLKNNPSRASELLASLAQEDPARVLAFLNSHPNPVMEVQMLSAIARKDPQLALGHLREMVKRGSLQRRGQDHIGDQLFRELAKNNPAALESELDSLPGPWRLRAEGSLAAERLKASFPEELKNLISRADGLKLFQAAVAAQDGLQNQLIDHFADLPEAWRRSIGNQAYQLVNQGNAARWLSMDLSGMGFDERQVKNLRYMAIQYQAFKDPSDAIKKMAGFELEKHQRQSLISNIFSNAARTPEKAEQLMAALENEEDREIARLLMAARGQGESPEVAVSAPKDWLDKMAGVDPQQSYRYLHLLNEWPTEKITALSDEFRSMPEEKKLSVAKVLAGGQLDSGDTKTQSLQGDAIRYLVSQPAPPKEETQAGQASEDPFASSRQIDLPAAASRHAVFLANKDPDAAVQWVQSLPGGEAKQWAQKNLATNWAKYDPEAMAQWMGTLPTAEQKEVKAYLEKKRQ